MKGKILSPYPRSVSVGFPKIPAGANRLLKMKRYNRLFSQIVSFENIYSGYLKARRGKRFKKDVLLFTYFLEYNLTGIKKELEKENYVHGGYKEFIVRDSKKRTIRAPCFKDRIMHHALCNVVEPIFEKTFIFDSYACRKGKGTHRALKRLKTWLKASEGYCLKCDISKYFDSVNQAVLLGIIEKKIKDKKVINLIKEIISSFNKETKIGIPIGNLTSQLFANIFLNQLDQFVKRELRSKYFIRYMDDFLILGEKQDLHYLKEKISDYLQFDLKLKLHPKKANIFPSSKGIDFLGYVIFKNHVLLRKSTVKRFLKKTKKVKKEERINAWFAYAKHADSFRLTKKLKTHV